MNEDFFLLQRFNSSPQNMKVLCKDCDENKPELSSLFEGSIIIIMSLFGNAITPNTCIFTNVSGNLLDREISLLIISDSEMLKEERREGWALIIGRPRC